MPDPGLSLAVGGVVPLTSLDFPGRLAAVVFLQGCPWACGYCHNGHLQPPGPGLPGGWASVVALLRRRRGLLDGVVFSGGEPTLQDALPDALREVRALGFQTGLHTSGAYPERLRGLLPLLDWVGLDVKAAFDDYEAVTGVPGSGAKVRESVETLVAGGIQHELRTTVHPRFHSPRSLLALGTQLRALGARRWYLQEFRPEGCADDALKSVSARGLAGPDVERELAGMFEGFAVRRA